MRRHRWLLLLFLLLFLLPPACAPDSRSPAPVIPEDSAILERKLEWTTGELRVRAVEVSLDFLSTGDIFLGRGFIEPDLAEDPPVFVMSQALWQELGEDPTVIGTTTRLNGVETVLVGVAREGLGRATSIDIFLLR